MGNPLDSRNADICNLYQSGEALNDIADTYDMTYERVRQILNANGIFIRKTAPASTTFSYEDLVAALGETTAKRVVTARNLRQIATPYPPSDDLAAVRAVVSGERIDRSSSWYTIMGRAALAWFLENDGHRLRFVDDIEALIRKRLQEGIGKAVTGSLHEK